MAIKQFSRLSVIAVLLALTMTVIQAQQTPLPVPIAADRGVRTNIAPFYVMEQYASSVRAASVTVTTTADENGTCDQDGTGLSLREALTACAATNDHYTVFVPAGDYLLDSPINVGAENLMLIGENPATTNILADGEPRAAMDYLLSFVPAGNALSIMNMTFTNQSMQANFGGALVVAGSGSLVLSNMLFEGNFATSGGAVYIETGTAPLHANINYSAFANNGAMMDGAAIFFDGSDSSGSHLWVQNSIFVGNTSGYASCNHGGSAILGLFDQPGGDSVTIDSTAFYENAISSATMCGGAVATVNGNGPVSLNVSYSEFISNSVPGGRGGAIYAASVGGMNNISNSLFADNSAHFGGAIYDASSALVNIDVSQFYENTAFELGGALYVEGVSLNLTYSDFSDNGAVALGGAAYISDAPAFIAYTAITSNYAGDENGSGGQGGGLYLLLSHTTLHNMFLEDNFAETGPDCVSDGLSPQDVVVHSLGGVGITDTAACPYLAHESDQVNNLLNNGGFEFSGSTPKFPAFWTPKNITKDKLNCNGQTPFGYCALMLKGSAAEKAAFSQNISGASLSLDAGDTLKLYAVGRGGKPSKVQVIATIVYSTPGQAATIAKLNFMGSTGGDFLDKSATLTVADSAISKIQVKIINKSKSGKFYLDRVYLFDSTDLGVPLVPRGALPAPAAPSGFRGNN